MRQPEPLGVLGLRNAPSGKTFLEGPMQTMRSCWRTMRSQVPPLTNAPPVVLRAIPLEKLPPLIHTIYTTNTVNPTNTLLTL